MDLSGLDRIIGDLAGIAMVVLAVWAARRIRKMDKEWKRLRHLKKGDLPIDVLMPTKDWEPYRTHQNDSGEPVLGRSHQRIEPRAHRPEPAR